MSFEFNPENRNFNVPARCCSFCRRAGHNITTCDSEPIHIFRRNLLDLIQSTSQDPRQLGLFRDYLLNEALYAPNVVRAFAIRYCGSNTRSNMDRCIELIIEYFMSQNQNVETNNQNILEAPAAEEAQPQQEPQPGVEPGHHSRRGRRFGFSEPGLDYFINGSTRNDPESILYAMMFIEIMRNINQESISFNTKFHIKTKISEKQYDLHEKCECSICYDEHEKQQFIKLDCGHEFCKNCIKQYLQNERRKSPCCAFCRADINNFEIRQESIKNDFDELITSQDEV